MSLVLSAAQMKAMDRAAIETLGVPSVVLMENAGRGVAALVRRERPGARDVRVVCGAGSNGGDGFVIARHLANAGARVTVLLATAPAKITGDAAVFLRVVERMPAVTVKEGTGDWRALLAGADVIVDAIFGTGLRSDVTGVPAAAIAAINATGAFRVAVDLPSGLDGDTGMIRGIAVHADLTATMACRKLGLVLDADAPVGRLEVVDIGISPPSLTSAVAGPHCHWIESAEIAAVLPRRGPSSHKGTAGHVLAVAGAPGKTGAAALVGKAALRAGAGLVTVASTRAGQAALDAKVLEVMTASYADGEDADGGSYDRVAALASRMKAVAVGPGIPDGPAMKALVFRLAAELPLPLVMDADALNLMGTEAGRILAGAPAPRLLTPHPGEMARLVGVSTAEVQKSRLEHARRLAAATKAVVVLKGARTIVAAPDGTAFINPAANASLGTAGSGDVLTGVLVALCGQGLSALDAARAGVHIHGLAAEEASAAVGTSHLVAGELAEGLGIGRALDRVRRIGELHGDDRVG
jgi:ADP-dependent NAD(P)H-hydrate dehydratase / NAD(P)H-hydrate epimerase